jgi:hypothetical protein
MRPDGMKKTYKSACFSIVADFQVFNRKRNTKSVKPELNEEV